MRKCSIESLNAVFEKIAAAETLYMPVDGENGADYKAWQEGTVMSDALNTERSAKDFFFPQTEDIVEFKVTGREIEVIDIRQEKEDFVVFGVRACDAKSFEILDKVFLVEPCDSYYANRREHGTVVTMACTKPVETCFCQTFDVDATNPGGDVTCWKTESDVYFQANNEKGEAFLAKIADLTEEADDAAVKAQQAATAEIMKKLPLAGLTPDKFGADKTDEFFDAPEWADLSKTCLGCGTCTFVCPTCQCYDIKEFNTGNGVIRFRCWDSCMYSDFTRMAHGNNRNSQLERFRQRFMHKLVYFPTNNEGEFGCVGCGRCLAKCPISMNIVKVMKTIGGKANE